LLKDFLFFVNIFYKKEGFLNNLWNIYYKIRISVKERKREGEFQSFS
jgi:hypothetical protein